MTLSLDRLNVFYQVIKWGTYKKASEVLGIKGPAISHQITSLEDNFGVQLLIRGRRQLRLTPQGQILYEILKKGLPQLDVIEELVGTIADAPKGKLNVMTWYGIASFLLTRHVGEFVETYPEISLSIQGNIIEDEFDHLHSDSTINTYQENQPDLIQHYLFSTQFRAYASPAYINKYGRPKNFDDLDNHRLISVAEKVPAGTLDLSEWHLRIGRKQQDSRKPFLVINSSDGCANLASRGVGIVNLPTYHREMIKDKLIDLFPDYDPPATDFYYAYPKHLKNVKRITLFGEFLKEKLGSKRKKE